MHLTAEQQQIIASKGDIRINAVAGSGKTTTLVAYAASRPKDARILYLAFNRSVKNEADKKFAHLPNVKIETAHSLAYKHESRGRKLSVKAGYKSHEIVSVLGLKNFKDKHEPYILANHIRKYVSYFCNSNKAKVQDLDYREVVSEEDAKEFVNKAYDKIVQGTRAFMAKMYKGETEIIHDYYLKQFQLQTPSLPYDYILFDEGQDASGAMLDVFLKQRAVKVIVGDTHQQIYSWRYAINSLESIDTPSFNLGSSFRFNHHIADLANEILDWKSHFKTHQPVQIKGAGGSKTLHSRATIARTNLALLIRAIDFMESHKKPKIYFEGNINSYTYADEGASIYDVYNLHTGNSTMVRDPMIKTMRDIEELRDYVSKTADHELGMILDVVDEYGKDLPNLLKKLKACHVPDEDKHKADMIFSTVHRSKGMEYDEVTLANDFISEQKIMKMMKEDTANGASLNEEVNLLYVAATRTRNILHIPEELTGKESNANIKVVPLHKEEPANARSSKSNTREQRERKYALSDKRKSNPNAYKPWTKELDEELTRLFCDDWTEPELAAHFSRNLGAINSRIKKLELYEKYR